MLFIARIQRVSTKFVLNLLTSNHKIFAITMIIIFKFYCTKYYSTVESTKYLNFHLVYSQPLNLAYHRIHTSVTWLQSVLMYSWLSLTHTGYHMTYHCCHRPVVRGKQFQPLRKDSTAYKNTTFDCQIFFYQFESYKNCLFNHI